MCARKKNRAREFSVLFSVRAHARKFGKTKKCARAKSFTRAQNVRRPFRLAVRRVYVNPACGSWVVGSRNIFCFEGRQRRRPRHGDIRMCVHRNAWLGARGYFFKGAGCISLVFRSVFCSSTTRVNVPKRTFLKKCTTFRAQKSKKVMGFNLFSGWKVKKRQVL